MAPIRKDDRLVEPHDDDEASRSLFAAKWFRVVLVFLVVGVIAAIAVPYVIDYLNPPAKPVVSKAPLPPAPPPAPGAAPSAPGAPGAPGAPAPATPAKPGAPATATPAKPGTKSPTTTPGQPPAVAAKPEATAPKVAAKPVEPTGGVYWVQVGAFRDTEHAGRLAATLRQQNFNATESAGKAAAARSTDGAAALPTSVDRYDVYVAGASASTLSARLGPKGLSAESASDGAVVRPSLVLRDAVTLSK